MGYTVSKVRNSKPEVLTAAASDAEKSAQRVDAQIVQCRAEMASLRESWVGTASDAAGKQYGELVGYQQAYSTQLSAVKAALDKHGPKLVEFKSQLVTAVDHAEDRWDVADDGSVAMGFWLKVYVAMNPAQWVKVEAMRIALENHIKLLLAKFEAEDVAAGYAIRQIGRELT